MTPEERAVEVQRIRSAMILQDYYIMHRRPAQPERNADVMPEHFQWLVRLEKEGRILVTGGIFMRDGTQSEGLTILRAANWDAAEALAASGAARSPTFSENTGSILHLSEISACRGRRFFDLIGNAWWRGGMVRKEDSNP